MDPVSFVKSLEIEDFVQPRSSTSHAPTLVQGKDQGCVDAGSLVSFVSNLTGQNKEDVLNSTMLAQLAANKKHDRYKDTKNWYKFYLTVMENIGWVMQDFKFSKYHSHQSSFKISQVALEILAAMLGKDAKVLDVAKATIESLAKSPGGVELFGRKSSSPDSGNFQIIPCTVDKSGQVNVAFLGSHFKAKSSFSNYFFFTWKSQSIDLFYTTESITLNESVYSQVRREVKKKLGKHAKEYVKDLDI